MADKTGIEWADATWNPVTGCTKVSPGCTNCYADTFAERWRGKAGHYFEQGFDVVLRPDKLDQPMRWTKPRRIFVNSMSDLFHDQVTDEYIARVFAVMALTPHHTYLLLTKRHGRMRSLLNAPEFQGFVSGAAVALASEQPGRWHPGNAGVWPLPNLHLGVSVEDQKRADLRIPALLDTPAAVRWLSCEPLLGPVELPEFVVAGDVDCPCESGEACSPNIDWVVVGGESGPAARPMHPDWARKLRDQCVTGGIAFFFKQWGEHLPVAVEDDPQFAGGRAFRNPRTGGRSAAVIRDRSTKAFHPGITRPMEAGDVNGLGLMLDDNTIAVRVGKKAAGRELDGRTWDELPQPAGVRS